MSRLSKIREQLQSKIVDGSKVGLSAEAKVVQSERGNFHRYAPTTVPSGCVVVSDAIIEEAAANAEKSGISPNSLNGHIRGLINEELNSFGDVEFYNKESANICGLFKLLNDAGVMVLTGHEMIDFEMGKQLLHLIAPTNKTDVFRGGEVGMMIMENPETVPKSCFNFCPAYCPNKAGLNIVETNNTMFEQDISTWEYVTGGTLKGNGDWEFETITHAEYCTKVGEALVDYVNKTSRTHEFIVKAIATQLFPHALHKNMLFANTAMHSANPNDPANVANNPNRARLPASDRRAMVGKLYETKVITENVDASLIGAYNHMLEVGNFFFSRDNSVAIKNYREKQTERDRLMEENGTSRKALEVGGVFRQGGSYGAYPKKIEEGMIQLSKLDSTLLSRFIRDGNAEGSALPSFLSAFKNLISKLGGGERNLVAIPLASMIHCITNIEHNNTSNVFEWNAAAAPIVADYLERGDFKTLIKSFAPNSMNTFCAQTKLVTEALELCYMGIVTAPNTFLKAIGFSGETMHSVGHGRKETSYVVSKAVKPTYNIHPGYTRRERSKGVGNVTINYRFGVTMPKDERTAKRDSYMKTMVMGYQTPMMQFNVGSVGIAQKFANQSFKENLGPVAKLSHPKKEGSVKVHLMFTIKLVNGDKFENTYSVGDGQRQNNSSELAKQVKRLPYKRMDARKRKNTDHSIGPITKLRRSTLLEKKAVKVVKAITKRQSDKTNEFLSKSFDLILGLLEGMEGSKPSDTAGPSDKAAFALPLSNEYAKAALEQMMEEEKKGTSAGPPKNDDIKRLQTIIDKLDVNQRVLFRQFVDNVDTSRLSNENLSYGAVRKVLTFMSKAQNEAEVKKIFQLYNTKYPDTLPGGRFYGTDRYKSLSEAVTFAESKM